MAGQHRPGGHDSNRIAPPAQTSRQSRAPPPVHQRGRSVHLHAATGAAPGSNWRADRPAREQNVPIRTLSLARTSNSRPRRTAGVRASSSMSVDHAPWSSEMPSGRGWKPGSRRGQPRCPRRPSAGPAPLRWDMNYPPTNKSRCSTPIHAIGLSTTTARASALVPDPYRVGAACPQRVRWSQCGQSTDRH